MKVLKFGGTSVGSAPVINRVREIVAASVKAGEEPVVVVSALGGVTNLLLQTGETAASGSRGHASGVEEIIRRHSEVISGLFTGREAEELLNELQPVFDELKELIHGIHLIRELSPRSKDRLLAFGEQLSARIVSRAIAAAGFPSEYFDARRIIVTDSSFGNALVDQPATGELIRAQLPLAGKVPVVTGFIARNEKNETTTLGRGGSDYTAAIIGAALQADEIEIWTDVDGFMTADPRKVRKAIPIDSISYEEALEMTSFGAKVIYPPTIRPAYQRSVPIRIRNTFDPASKGTLITRRGEGRSHLLTGVSSLSDVSLVKIEGSSLGENPGIAGKVLSIVSALQVPVHLTSQASAGNSVVLCIPATRATEVEAKLREELKFELHFGMVEEVVVESGISVVTIIAENMRDNSSIPGRIFAALGTNGISIKAISQGSSRINLSLAVDAQNEVKALNVIHDGFFLAFQKTINLFVAGTGLIGRTLFQQIRNQTDFLSRVTGLEIRIAGLANSRKMLIEPGGIPLDRWEEELAASGDTSSFPLFAGKMLQANLPNPVFVDCTSSEEVIGFYEEILAASVPVVTPNKKANTSSYEKYLNLKTTAERFGVPFLYETNVGAGLPVISTLNDLIVSGDKVKRIEGVLSGTLSYLFNRFDGVQPFSALLKDAVAKGYTEPDPRDDLSGTDVARKLLILIRESGYQAELGDIKIEGLVPRVLEEGITKEEFLDRLSEFDDHFLARLEKAKANGCRLRYVAFWEGATPRSALLKWTPPTPFTACRATTT